MTGHLPWPVALAAIVSFFAVSPVAEPAAPGPCKIERSVCRHVTVPLDRSGRLPGSVHLRVQRIRAVRPSRPPVVVFAAAPGASAIREQFFPAAGSVGIERFLGGQRRDILLIDLRGTGGSDALQCEALQSRGFTAGAGAAAECAASLGAAARHYSIRESVRDVDAVRTALHIRRVALFGDGFGATIALAYARRYPGRVERMVLHSPRAVGPIDPFFRAGMQSAPRLLSGICPGSPCRAGARTSLSDFRGLGRRLQAGPLSGTVGVGDGTRKPAAVGAFDLFDLLASGGVDPVGLAQLPAAVRSAAKGDPLPLLRTVSLSASHRPPGVPPTHQSVGAATAQLCQFADLPWRRGTSMTQRSAAVRNFLLRVPARSFGLFGRAAAAGSHLVELCRGWPASGRRAEPRRRLRVPALVLAGGWSLVAPPMTARAVADELPLARLRVIKGHWDSPYFDDPSGCVPGMVDDFLAGRLVENANCPPSYLSVRQQPEAPRSLAEVTPLAPGGDAGRTLEAVRLTARDGVQSILRQPGTQSMLSAGGLRDGSYLLSRVDRDTAVFELRSASFVPGVTVTGTLIFRSGRSADGGHLEVSGSAAASGTLEIRGELLQGALGGVAVSVPLRADYLIDAGVSNGY